MEGKGARIWTEIAVQPQRQRWELLSTELSRSGIENHYQAIEVESDAFDEQLKEILKGDYAGIRIGSPFGERVTRILSYEPALMMSLGAADSLVLSGDQWWTRSALFEALQKLLRQYAGQLNFTAEALIVGAGSAAKIAIAALVKIGFKRFKITNRFLDQGLSLIADLKKIYFGVHFEFTPVNQLIMLAGVHSIMVNTTPAGPQNELIQELLYFNFLEPGGEVWDFSLAGSETPLLLEAQHIGTKIVHGYEIASWVDVIWSEWTFGCQLDREEYMGKLIELLNKGPGSKEG